MKKGRLSAQALLALPFFESLENCLSEAIDGQANGEESGNHPLSCKAVFCV